MSVLLFKLEFAFIKLIPLGSQIYDLSFHQELSKLPVIVPGINNIDTETG